MNTFRNCVKPTLLKINFLIVICVSVLLAKTEVSHSYDSSLIWDSDIVLTEPIENCAVWQIDILAEYEKNKDEDIRARDAFILNQLWNEGLLKSEIKDYLVGKYYKLALIQSYGNNSVPNWQVQSQQSFPFPSFWVSFTPILYKNGQVEWAPAEPQTVHSMAINSSTITSHTGGVFENGDVIYYTIKIEQKENDEVLWEKTIKTNEVTLKGLKNLNNTHKAEDSIYNSSLY